MDARDYNCTEVIFEQVVELLFSQVVNSSVVHTIQGVVHDII